MSGHEIPRTDLVNALVTAAQKKKECCPGGDCG